MDEENVLYLLSMADQFNASYLRVNIFSSLFNSNCMLIEFKF